MTKDHETVADQIATEAGPEDRERLLRQISGLGNDEVYLRDVKQLAAALGLGTHARPYSAHAVIHREVLPAIRKLRETAIEMINHPDDSAADWGYDLAHQLGMPDLDGAP